MVFLLSGILFLTIQKCPNTPEWYAWLYPTTSLVAALLSLTMRRIPCDCYKAKLGTESDSYGP